VVDAQTRKLGGHLGRTSDPLTAPAHPLKLLIEMPDADGNATAEETAAAAAASQQHADAATLQQQLDQTQARNLELEVAALRAANPDLPEASFAGEDLAAVQTAVASARSVADHIRQQVEATRNGRVENPAATPAAAGTQRAPEPIPDNITGIARIARALEREQAGA